MGVLPRRRLTIIAGLAAAGILLGTAALSIEGIRWRAAVLAMKASGQIDDLPWPQLVSMIRPGSSFYLRPLVEAPNPYAVIRNPLTSESDREAGARLFQSRCALCHGANAEGETAPSLVGRTLRMGDSDWSLFRSVTQGRPELGMPMIPMPDEEAWQIVGYLRSLRNGTGAAGGLSEHRPPGLAHISVPAERIERAEAEPHNWLTYSGSYRSWRYSALDEITAENVAELKLAWSLQFDTTDHIEASPIVVDGIMFFSVPVGDVVAVDAATGNIIWRHTRAIPNDVPLCCGRVNRGVAVMGDRVYVGSLDGYLTALDAQTGRVIWASQVADYREGYSITAAPLAVRDKIVIGVAGGEYGIRGFLDAYDAATGERAWRFYTIPEPGQPGSETWGGDSWRTGGGPTWLTGSFDPSLGLLYWGVGNPSPGYNGDLRPGDNLFTASVLALDVDSGELEWHYQFTPHDVHDWDSNQVPVLVDHEIDGQQRQLMLWANRNGFFYVLDRRTGEFLNASPFVEQSWAEGMDKDGRPIVVPGSEPSQQGTLTWPGHFGGTNWWSPSYSPDTDLFYVSFMEAPKVFFKDVDLEPGDFSRGQPFIGSAAVPTGDPFHGGVRALDPVTGEIVWEYLTPSRLDAGWMGGTLVSAGNVVFFGDVNDFVAYHAEEGRELWRVNLGGIINASPVTFTVAGAQRVAIAAGSSFFVFRL